MQEEHAKEEAEMVHDETMPILRAIEELKADVAALRAETGARKRRSRS
jgi:hypothetical protein